MLEDIVSSYWWFSYFENLGIKLENVKLEDLGSVKKVKVDKDNSTIVNGSVKNQI